VSRVRGVLHRLRFYQALSYLFVVLTLGLIAEGYFWHRRGQFLWALFMLALAAGYHLLDRYDVRRRGR
jgi:hypothetical protein